MMKCRIIISCVILLLSCRGGKKESIYLARGEEETRKLTLLKDNTFILEISTDYYNRVDTGIYKMNGDTLILNPASRERTIDSVQYVDELLSGRRFVEVYEEEVEFDTNNVIVESFYRAIIFPQVVINDSLALSVSAADSSFRKAEIPDSITASRLEVRIQESNSCKPQLTYYLQIAPDVGDHKSYLIFIPSRRNRENYLPGFKWLVKEDTIISFFANEECDPVGLRLIRER
jgi:hypothetical protein